MDIFCFQYFKLGQVIAIWGKEGSTCRKAVFLNGVPKAQERPFCTHLSGVLFLSK